MHISSGNTFLFIQVKKSKRVKAIKYKSVLMRVTNVLLLSEGIRQLNLDSGWQFNPYLLGEKKIKDKTFP